MTQAVIELKTAIYAQLTGDSTLMAQVQGIFDYVPEDTDFPYVRLGDASEEDISVLGKTRTRVQLPITVFSRVRGSKECFTIIDRIVTLLHGVSLTLGTGYSLNNLRFVDSTVRQQSDGFSHIGVVRFVAVVEE